MIKSILTDFLQEALPANSRQKPVTGMSVIDETFQKIFSSIQETNQRIENRVEDSRAEDKRADNKILSERERDTYISHNETDETTRNEDENRNDIEEPVQDGDDNQETSTNAMNPESGDDENPELDESAKPGDKVVVEEKPASDEMDNEDLTEAKIKEKVLKLLKELLADSSQIKDTDKNLTSLEKVASMIAKKLFKLSESDPAAFEKLMEDLSKFSFKDNKGKNLGQAVSQMIELAKAVGAQGEVADNPDKKSLETLLKEALKPEGKTDNAPEDKKAASRDSSEKGEKRADGQPFDKVIVAGKDRRVNAKAANNKETAAKQATVKKAVAKQAISSEAVNSTKDQVKADVKPNTVKIINNIMAETNPPPGNSSKTASADQPQVRAKFASREMFERMLVDQIVKKARINVRANGASNITIQINPPHLGKVNIRISVHDSVVKAYMIAENPEVRSIIENNLDNLKNSMNNQGLKVDQITVTTQDAHTQDRNETMGNDFGSEGNRDNQGHALGADEALDMEGEMTIAQFRALAHDGVLNIVA